MDGFLGLFVIGCIVTVIVTAKKGKPIRWGKVVLYGLLFAIFFPVVFGIVFPLFLVGVFVIIAIAMLAAILGA